MISDNLAKPLSKVATKSFSKMHNPKETTIQGIFRDHWDDFFRSPEVARRGLRPIVMKEVQKMMDCGTLACGFEEEMLEWYYAEEADFMIDEGDLEASTWQCPKYFEETLIRKPNQ